VTTGYHYYYYFHRETGECRWEYPTAEQTKISSSSQSQAEGIVGLVDAAEVAAAVVAATAAASVSSTTGGDVASASPQSATVVKKSILKRSSDDPSTTSTSPNNTMDDGNNEEEASPSLRNSKRARVDTEPPREVRVLHILRKHIHSRRPSSWRVSNITDTKEKAMADLRELHSILSDIDPDNPKELRATFEEFAKTESDCSSAKRGGDLGFFGRKKMQPAFEKASFGLGVGQMTPDIVDTSSGVHLILRLA
jgi:NIMA-interacting peptidyl-prolyl cis-trans isomerase 1